MRALKCIFAVVLGSVLGLLSCCTRPPREAKPKAPPEKPAAAPQTNAVPAKQEDLPVRKPILE